MTRCAAILALLTLVSCKEKPKPPAFTPAERGAAFFAPAAEKLADVLVAEMNEAMVKQYLEETKSADKAALGRTIGKEILRNYGHSLALTEAQEAALKAGKFDDAGNLKRVNAAVGRFADTKAVVPKVCQITMMKVQSGDWKSGLQLEFAARVLEGHFTAGAHPEPKIDPPKPEKK